jgi:anti-sigma factor (TIGR02949 family)
MECDAIGRYLDLYLDGELAAEERAEIETHLRDCGACREATGREARIRTSMRQALLSVRAPRSLHDQVARRLREGAWMEPQRTVVLSYAAVALLVVGVGYSATLFLPGRTSPSDDAVAVHRQTTGTEVYGDRTQVAAFLRDHAPFPTRVPVADQDGLKLVGARVTKLGEVPAVLYLYEADGHRVSIAQYPTSNEGAPGLVVDQRSGLMVATWRDRDLTQTVVGDLPEPEVRRFIPASFGGR